MGYGRGICPYLTLLRRRGQRGSMPERIPWFQTTGKLAGCEIMLVCESAVEPIDEGFVKCHGQNPCSPSRAANAPAQSSEGRPSQCPPFRSAVSTRCATWWCHGNFWCGIGFPRKCSGNGEAGMGYWREVTQRLSLSDLFLPEKAIQHSVRVRIRLAGHPVFQGTFSCLVVPAVSESCRATEESS